MPYIVKREGKVVDTEWIKYKQWDDYARRIERKNLKEHGRSLSFTGISGTARSYIVEMRDDEKTMLVVVGWRAAMKEGGKPKELSPAPAAGEALATTHE